MLTWFRRREINRLLVELAGMNAYMGSWVNKGVSVAPEMRRIAEIKERLRQLGYKEQDNG